MGVLRDFAYGTYVGSFPMIALIGLLTYALVLSTALVASGKRWIRWLRRVPVKVHRAMGLLTLLVATLHLLMGLSLYVG
jgi:uncharacterized membrane protein